MKDVRKEYSRLRSIWRKRYERLLKSDYNDIKLVEDRPIQRYKQLKDITSDRELYHLLSELATIIASNRSTIIGLKQREKEQMKDLNKKYGTKLKTHEDLMNFGDLWKIYVILHPIVYMILISQLTYIQRVKN